MISIEIMPTDNLMSLRRNLEKDIQMAKKYYVPLETESALAVLQAELGEINSELSKRGID